MFWPGEQPLRKHAVVNWMSDSCDTIQILLFQKVSFCCAQWRARNL